MTTTPDGKQFYVTCEAGGDIYVIETVGFTAAAHFKVNGRPRSVAFLSGRAIGFIPSESAGELNIIDSANAKVLNTIALPAGSRPMRARLSIDEKKLYVSNGRAGTISVFDTSSYELLATIKVGTRPWGIGISPDGKFLYCGKWPFQRCVGGRSGAESGSGAGQSGLPVLGASPLCQVRRRRRECIDRRTPHCPTMNICCSVMLRVNPSLKARARITAVCVSLIGFS